MVFPQFFIVMLRFPFAMTSCRSVSCIMFEFYCPQSIRRVGATEKAVSTR